MSRKEVTKKIKEVKNISGGRTKKIVWGVGFGLVGLVILTGAWLLASAQIFPDDKIFKGVYVGDLALGGLSEAEARDLIQRRAEIFDKGTEFIFQDKKVVLSPSSVSFDGALAFQLFAIDPGATAKDAWAAGRAGSWWQNIWRQSACRLNRCQVPLAVDLNQQKIIDFLTGEFKEFEAPAENAKLVFADANYEISQEKFGHRFDYQAVSAIFLNNVANFKNEPIRLILEEEAPQIFAASVGDVSADIERWLALAPVTLTYDKDKWTVNKIDLRSWLGLRKDATTGQLSVAPLNDLVGAYLDKKVATKIDQPAKEAKFEMTGGRVNIFQASQEGVVLDKEASFAAIVQALEAGQKEVALITKTEQPTITDNNLDTMGIVEIIGTGTSSFAGSPANRRHNIKVGAAALNGLIVKPNEEFSLVKALGEIDGSTGYLQELVIKQNKTTPEYGGGLCQVGTTLFRTVVQSGLPVKERRNHSYRVQYYEPAGTDATIYNPWPDFKFANDTGNNILIQTRIEGNSLIFDFWGKKDGRHVFVGKPSIYNIVKPPAGKVIETLDLKPGVKKCTEGAHSGADAHFDYKVTYPNGEVKEERFYSHYVPWQSVCLLGVEKLSEPTGETSGETPPTTPGTDTATSTVN